MSQDDTTLLGLLAQGPEQHFHHLVAAYQHRLYAFALRYVGNTHDAEDLVQEALLQAYFALACYPAERIQTLLLKPWLFRILLNLFYRRKRDQQLPLTPLDLDEEGSHLNIEDNSADQPDQVVVRQEARREIAACIHLLPERYRAAINLYYFEELTQQEIARLLQLPLGTVKSLIYRGTILLRDSLQSYKMKPQHI